MTTLIKDCFTDVDIYDDEVRLLQYPFHSPISTRSAISFYRYFIEDTVMIGKDKCFELSLLQIIRRILAFLVRFT